MSPPLFNFLVIFCGKFRDAPIAEAQRGQVRYQHTSIHNVLPVFTRSNKISELKLKTDECLQNAKELLTCWWCQTPQVAPSLVRLEWMWRQLGVDVVSRGGCSVEGWTRLLENLSSLSRGLPHRLMFKEDQKALSTYISQEWSSLSRRKIRKTSLKSELFSTDLTSVVSVPVCSKSHRPWLFSKVWVFLSAKVKQWK